MEQIKPEETFFVSGEVSPPAAAAPKYARH